MTLYYVIIFMFLTITICVIYAKSCGNSENLIEKSLQTPKNKKPLTLDINQDQNHIPEKKKRKRCCPYAFDSSLCRIVDDRVLCGYNMNVGSPKSKNNVIDLQGDCRLRGGRLECGYQQGPFTNPRRPPVWNERLQFVGSKEHTVEEVIPEIDTVQENAPNQLKYLVKSTTAKSSHVTRCIEIRERIVCRKM